MHHVVDRENWYEDVIDMYREGDIVEYYPLVVKYKGKKAIDDGGVQRDIFPHFGVMPVLVWGKDSHTNGPPKPGFVHFPCIWKNYFPRLLGMQFSTSKDCFAVLDLHGSWAYSSNTLEYNC